MKETVAANGITLCHKHADGFVRSTLPDVSKAPNVPVPFVNVAFVKDLAKGTRSVHSHDGAMNGLKGSEFSVSIGDEPGVGGGVKSDVNMHRATFLSWSPDVFMEGRPVTRLTDKMLLNKGNTISIGGYYTGPVRDEKNRDLLNKICEFLYQCLAEDDMNQRCVARKLNQWAKQTGRNITPEGTYERGSDKKWRPRVRKDVSMRKSRSAGSRAPDVTDHEKKSIIENKLRNPKTGFVDRYQPGQDQDYDQIAEDNSLSREDIDFKNCDCEGKGRTHAERKEVEVKELDTNSESTIMMILRALSRRLGPPIYIPPSAIPGRLSPGLA